MEAVKGYKVFNSDWTCRGFKYEVGKTFKHDGDIELCGSGFHFCKKAGDCFAYYDFDSSNKVAEVLATGLIKNDEKKSVTNEITIVREILWAELLEIVNEGKNCTGLCNTGNLNTGNFNTGNFNTGNKNTGGWNTGDCNVGNRNTGDLNTGNCNTGNRNAGDWNTGYFNTGNRNTGDHNTGNKNIGYRNTGDYNTGNYNAGNYNTGYRNAGDWNAGDWNAGDYNTGDFNTGDLNTGDWNLTDYSTGIFNTEQKNIYIFDKESNWTMEDWKKSETRNIFTTQFALTKWINEKDMSYEEKGKHPGYKTTGGYLKEFTVKEACKNMWDNLTEEEKEIIVTELPNFDADKFELITGIDIGDKFKRLIK